MINKTTITGFIIGCLLPIIGLFFGLQINVMLGNILAFPFVLGSILTGIPFGNWPGSVILLTIGLSGLFWAFVFYHVRKIMPVK